MSVVLRCEITTGFHAAVPKWQSGFPYRDIRDPRENIQWEEMCHCDMDHISNKSENDLTKSHGHPKPIWISRNTLNVVFWIDTIEIVACKCSVKENVVGFLFYYLIYCKESRWCIFSSLLSPTPLIGQCSKVKTGQAYIVLPSTTLPALSRLGIFLRLM